MTPREFIVRELSRKGSLPAERELDDLDYHEAGYVDSMGLLKFVATLEREFDIDFSEAEVESQAFRVVKTLVALVEDKRRSARAPASAQSKSPEQVATRAPVPVRAERVEDGKP